MLIWTATILVRDAKAHIGKIILHLASLDFLEMTADFDDPGLYIQQFVTQMDGLVDGKIVDIKLTLNVALPGGLKVTPHIDSDIEAGARLVWRTVDNTTVKTRFPTWDEAYITPGGNLTDDPDVEDFLFLITNPGDTAANWSSFMTDQRGARIVELVKDREDFQATRNR
jgi:hypothetical protein